MDKKDLELELYESHEYLENWRKKPIGTHNKTLAIIILKAKIETLNELITKYYENQEEGE